MSFSSIQHCSVKHNSESVFRNFPCAVNSNYSKNVIEKIFMLSVVIEAFKKSVIFPPYTFRKSLFVIQRLGFISPCIAYQSD